MDWCTIESDPGVFTSLVESFGVQNAQLSELWSLDDESLQQLCTTHGGVFGLIFLFKWDAQLQAAAAQRNNTNENSSNEGALPEDLFFAKQVTTNACATQAILSILLNAKTSTDMETKSERAVLSLGDELSNFKSFTSSFPPELKGEAIGSNTHIQTAHNSFAKKDGFLFEGQKRVATSDDDVFHFVAYVPHDNGYVYELDGLQAAPISIGQYDISLGDSSWLSTARSAIQSRMEAYSSQEIQFLQS